MSPEVPHLLAGSAEAEADGMAPKLQFGRKRGRWRMDREGVLLWEGLALLC